MDRQLLRKHHLAKAVAADPSQAFTANGRRAWGSIYKDEDEKKEIKRRKTAESGQRRRANPNAPRHRKHQSDEDYRRSVNQARKVSKRLEKYDAKTVLDGIVRTAKRHNARSGNQG